MDCEQLPLKHYLLFLSTIDFRIRILPHAFLSSSLNCTALLPAGSHQCGQCTCQMANTSNTAESYKPFLQDDAIILATVKLVLVLFKLECLKTWEVGS